MEVAADLGLESFGARAGFPLSRVADPATIEVKVDGSPVTPPAWSFDAPANTVVAWSLSGTTQSRRRSKAATMAATVAEVSGLS